MERKIWGRNMPPPEGGGRGIWVDLLLVAGLAGLLWGLFHLGRQWTGQHERAVNIDVDNLWMLPKYTFFSLMRGLVAYGLSLGFTLVYGYWAAKDHLAERVLIPLLDILQSIPVLSFMPGLVLALVALFPSTNFGLELAAVIMIFTGQAWNMTFSFYHSLRAVPQDLREAASVYRLNWWQRFKWLELPFSTMGLVWNSMMSMAGGWFFLMVNESFRLGDDDFRLPGLGSYMSVAVDRENYWAMGWAIFAMIAMIVALDQLLWRPVVVWAQKFRFEEGGEQIEMSSWFLDLLRRSRLLVLPRYVAERLARWREARAVPHKELAVPAEPAPRRTALLSYSTFALLVLVLGTGAVMLVQLLWQVPLREWGETFVAAGWTLSRVLVSTALGALWAVPAGLAIGLSPRLSRVLQPVVQVAASFPAPMLFPLVVLVLQATYIPLGVGSILLMLLGTQWYILFNVVAGAMAIPADLREAARSYRLTRWMKFWSLYLPAIFPYLVTGCVTAAGGAWNASIVSEYVTVPNTAATAAEAKDDGAATEGDGADNPDGEPAQPEEKVKVLYTWGLGAMISRATTAKNFPLLGACTLVMSLVVVTLNRTFWKRCYELAESRFSLNK
jgi:NitT/TauT family transport system permease protein